VDPAFSASISTQNSCDLIFSYDNLNPLMYNGSTVSQQEGVTHEMELLNLVLPNQTVAVGGLGSRVSFYPYLYVEISNVSATGTGAHNSIITNNPHGARAVFRVILDDTTDRLISAFVNLRSNMVQSIKFKPNDSLFVRVSLSTGELFQTVVDETYSPQSPNPMVQISGMIGIRRVPN